MPKAPLLIRTVGCPPSTDTLQRLSFLPSAIVNRTDEPSALKVASQMVARSCVSRTDRPLSRFNT